MEYLEGRGIVHRDLAARNVLGKFLYLLSCLMSVCEIFLVRIRLSDILFAL